MPVTKPPLDWHRVISAAAAVLWLALAAIAGLPAFLIQFSKLLVPVACIWFADDLAELTTTLPGPLSMMPITRPVPAGLLRFFAWVALLSLTAVPVLVSIFLAR
jgi:hypothetical protein